MAITATENTTTSASEPPKGARFRPSRTWLFPSGQPRWARPGLLAVAALAALIFTWGAFHTATNNFYAADARSMSMSWKNFLYGSFDPAGSVTIDKLWGFLWPQALSIKIFGYHAWALALPEAIEGVISVLVLYRLTRRWTGRSDIALLSAGLFTLTPIVAATFGHSGLEDNALTMCLILATDAFQRACNEGRLRSLALSGFWIGMAFQTKMVQAWTVVPVFALVYLICGPHPLLKRIKHTLVFGAVTAAASLWLMVIVQLTPASDRPFIDGSNGSNNIFTMVFDYNFTSRFSSVTGSTSGGSFGGGGTDYGKLFGASFGSQIGWLYPLALVALVFGLIKLRGTGRADGERAGYLMWAGTLGITALAFSAGTIPHSQYMTVLAPGLAALGAAGIVGLFRSFRDDEKLGWLLIVAIAATVAWATHLSYENTVFLSWLPPLVIALGLSSILLLVAYRIRKIGTVLAAGTCSARRRWWRRPRPGRCPPSTPRRATTARRSTRRPVRTRASSAAAARTAAARPAARAARAGRPEAAASRAARPAAPAAPAAARRAAASPAPRPAARARRARAAAPRAAASPARPAARRTAVRPAGPAPRVAAEAAAVCPAAAGARSPAPSSSW
jgi:4-amino-4-deoxy-L-arabinose transferase-like glycosyltransferase